jgi:hypothetical protein
MTSMTTTSHDDSWVQTWICCFLPPGILKYCQCNLVCIYLFLFIIQRFLKQMGQVNVRK